MVQIQEVGDSDTTDLSQDSELDLDRRRRYMPSKALSQENLHDLVTLVAQIS